MNAVESVYIIVFWARCSGDRKTDNNIDGEIWSGRTSKDPFVVKSRTTASCHLSEKVAGKSDIRNSEFFETADASFTLSLSTVRLSSPLAEN